MKVKLINPDIREDYSNNLLKARGIENVEGFLSPVESFLQSPTALDNIEEGKALIKQIAVNWKILLVVDSDADGYCSGAIIYQYLKRINKDFLIDFIVHEEKQHGLEDVVQRIDINNYDLVLLPDAGSNDDEYIAEYPDTHFLILDHHERTLPITELPKNAVLINNQTSAQYINKSLCGAGVVWQFCRALDDEFKLGFAERLIDLAAVAIVGDVMNITTLENRYIIHTGLANIKNKFLVALIDKQSFVLGAGPLTPIGVAFYIVPLINSMCRTGSLIEKERMFVAFIDGDRQVECFKRGAKGTTEKAAIESARECTNTKAKQSRLQDKMASLAEIQIINNNLLDNKILIITLDDLFNDIPSEINGLAATRLSNKYRRPTLIGRVGTDNKLKGSIRGLGTLDMPPLKDFLMNSGLFDWVEGHQLAAGYSIPASKVNLFHEWANEQLKNVDMDNDLWEVDFERNAMDDDIGDLINDLDEIKFTWGQGNPEALIYVKNINIPRGDIQVIGSKGDTVKIVKNDIVYMFFKCDENTINKLKQYNEAQIDVVGTMNVNVYYNTVTAQVFVKDFEVRDGEFLF